MAASKLSSLLDVPARKISPPIASEALQLIRASNLYAPTTVLQLGNSALNQHSPSSRPYWDIVEQISQAAAECGEREICRTFLRKIMAHFPNSVRAFVLQGMFLESNGDLRGAMSNYIDVIDKRPIAPLMYKRQVAVLKSEMKMSEAIALLNHYIDIYSDDVDAWAELCALSLSVGRFSHALFAANELLLNDPDNFAYHILVADIYMTCSGKDNLLLARKHYSASLNARRGSNLRALYGLWMSCSLLLNEDLGSYRDRRKCEQLLDLSKQGIKAVYASIEAPPGKTSFTHVDDTLSSNIFTGKKNE